MPELPQPQVTDFQKQQLFNQLVPSAEDIVVSDQQPITAASSNLDFTDARKTTVLLSPQHSVLRACVDINQSDFHDSNLVNTFHSSSNYRAPDFKPQRSQPAMVVHRGYNIKLVVDKWYTSLSDLSLQSQSCATQSTLPFRKKSENVRFKLAARALTKFNEINVIQEEEEAVSLKIEDIPLNNRENDGNLFKKAIYNDETSNINNNNNFSERELLQDMEQLYALGLTESSVEIKRPVLDSLLTLLDHHPEAQTQRVSAQFIAQIFHTLDSHKVALRVIKQLSEIARRKVYKSEIQQYLVAVLLFVTVVSISLLSYHGFDKSIGTALDV